MRTESIPQKPQVHPQIKVYGKCYRAKMPMAGKDTKRLSYTVCCEQQFIVASWKDEAKPLLPAHRCEHLVFPNEF
jgi:hypothetical protein